MFWKAPILPLTFARYTCGFGGLDRVPCSTDGMAGHVGRRHRLTRSTSGATRCGTSIRFASSGVGCERICSHIGHLKHASTSPRPTGCYGLSRTRVIRISLLETWKHMLSAVSRPNCQCLLVAPAGSMTHGEDLIADTERVRPMHGWKTRNGLPLRRACREPRNMKHGRQLKTVMSPRCRRVTDKVQARVPQTRRPGYSLLRAFGMD